MKKIVTFLLVLTSGLSMASQGNEWWSDISGAQARTSGDVGIQTSHCRYLHLQLANIANYLSTSPMEFTEEARLKNVELELPSPDGSFQRFRIVESPVCEPELAAKFPETRTWAGQGIDDATATVRLDVTPFGFHAMILSANGDIFIDPVNLQTSENYICYFRKDCIRRNQSSVCAFNPEDEWNAKQKEELRAIYNNHHDEQRSMGDNLRTYTLALGCTGEYAAVFGGTVSGAHAAMVTSVNRVTGVYEKELAIRLTLIANNDTLIFLNSATDPYDNNNGSTMLAQNQTTVTNRIGSLNYDIGHVFSTGGGGIAGLGVVCTAGQKARGVTGLPNPQGDAFDIDFVAHEMGHQFGGNHSFNSVTGNCGGGNRNASTAYEPGSGITIMGYAGICGSDDLAAHSIANFHTVSFDEIEDYTSFASGSTCPTTTATGNNPPTPALTDYHYDIPLMTPFTLTGIGSDPDGDTITYSWEEFDLGPGGAWNAPSGNAPIFTSIAPSQNPTRLFPKLTNVLNNIDSKGEKKASYARTLNFRLTLRDNRLNGGGVTYDDAPVEVNVVNTTVPFAITYPNTTGIQWLVGSSQTITWNVANSTAAPISTPNVNIYLSTTGGTTYPFPILIASGVPNNGSYTLTVPNNLTTTARILVEGEGNIFFDINDKNFTITNTISVDEAVSVESTNLVPNPAQENIQLIMSGPIRGQVDASIFDVSGRLVKSASYNKQTEGMVQDMDINNLQKGIYTISLQTEKGIITKKFTKL